MTGVVVLLALAVVGAGLVLAVAHLIGFAVLRARRIGPRPEFLPWGYVGVGLVLSLLGFYLARGLQDGAWGVVQDLTGLVLVLAVCSWGFGAAYEWATLRFGARLRWVWPLVLSTVTGAVLGLAARSLAV